MVAKKLNTILCGSTAEYFDSGTSCLNSSNPPASVGLQFPHISPVLVCKRKLTTPLPQKHDHEFVSLHELIEELKNTPSDLKEARKVSLEIARAAKLSSNIGKRLAGVRAFHDDYYNLLSDELKPNKRGDRTGTVRRGGATARRYFDALDGYYKSIAKLVVFLDLAGIPLKASEFSWQDRSLKGISANTFAAVAQWSTEKVWLTVPRVTNTAVHSIGKGAGVLGYTKLERDFSELSRVMDNGIEKSEKWISRVMSPSNARDVMSERSVFNNLPLLGEEIANRAPTTVRDAMTWERSVVNPDNLPLLFEEIVIKSHELHDTIVEAIESVTD